MCSRLQREMLKVYVIFNFSFDHWYASYIGFMNIKIYKPENGCDGIKYECGSKQQRLICEVYTRIYSFLNLVLNFMWTFKNPLTVAKRKSEVVWWLVEACEFIEYLTD